MIEKRYFKKWIGRIAAAFVSLLLVLSWSLPMTPKVSAFADAALALDSTTIESDLKDIDLSQYPKDAKGTPKVYTMMEYSYSDNPFGRENFALYLYVYNPSCTAYAQLTGANVVNMASAYQTNEDGSFSETDSGALRIAEYRNFNLKYCGATTGDFENLFVKFRIMGLSGVLENAVKMDDSGRARQYDVAGIQLYKKGADNATDYQIAEGGKIDEGGRTYFFSGYAKGLGEGAESESTLEAWYEDLGVAHLNVEHTSYKTGVSAAGKYHQNEIQTVYFALDNRFMQTYGRLQKIAAQWYEYKLTPSIVAETEIYNKLKEYVGVDIGTEYDETLPYSIHQIYNHIGSLASGSVSYEYSYAYNTKMNLVDTCTYVETMLRLLFEATGDVNAHTVKGEDVLAAAKAYGQGSGETLPIKDGTVPADCFIEADEGRTTGYNYREFDADVVSDQWNLLAYDDTHSDWDKFWDYGFGGDKVNTDETLKGVLPIYEVKAADMEKGDEELSSSLLIGQSDVSAFRKYYETATKDVETYPEGCSVILFRFAATDYYAAPLTVMDIETKQMSGSVTSDYFNWAAEVRQSTAFLDFEIISLTFNKDGALTVIGVVSSPIDAVGDQSPAIVGGGCNEVKIQQIIIIAVIAIGVIVLIKLFVTLNEKRKINAAYRASKKGRKRK